MNVWTEKPPAPDYWDECVDRVAKHHDVRVCDHSTCYGDTAQLVAFEANAPYRRVAGMTMPAAEFAALRKDKAALVTQVFKPLVEAAYKYPGFAHC